MHYNYGCIKKGFVHILNLNKAIVSLVLVAVPFQLIQVKSAEAKPLDANVSQAIFNLIKAPEPPSFPDRSKYVDEIKAKEAAEQAERDARAAFLVQARDNANKAKTNAPAVAGGSVWDLLAQCESGGRWNTNTSNGYYGGLQFNYSTWGGYGGYATADLAPREVQIEKAEQIRARRGFAPWPACASKLGLL